MRPGRFLVLVFCLCALILSASSQAFAQAGTSAIAGTVTDATGGVLPGVTVEASSPALLEGTRTVISDAQGKYSIVSLVAGTYAVTFTLPGFSVVKREGVTLTAGFTAPVNAELKVGSLEETVTVTGASPIVDVQNVRTQNVLQREELDALPSAQNLGSFAALTLGVVFGGASTQDVGGSAGEQGTAQVHNSRGEDQKFAMDGMNTNNSMGTNGGAFHAGQHYNMEAMQETTMAFSGMSAETETAGLQVNFVPKDGGNRFSGSGRAFYTNGDFQSVNVGDELRRRGATTPGKVKKIYDYGGGFGGPIQKDKIWFFTGHRWWGNETFAPGSFFNRVQGTGRYEPDTSRPGFLQDRNRDNSGRITWQMSSKDKFGYYGNFGDQCVCNLGVGVLTAPEAVLVNALPQNHLSQATWNRVQTSKLLFEAGFTFLHNPFGFPHPEGVSETDIPTLELSTGFNFNARASALYYNDVAEERGGGLSQAGQQNARASFSYVTGTHAFKVGFQWAHGLVEQNGAQNELPGFGPISLRTLNGRPNSIVQWASPKYSRSDFRNMALYGQDQWSLKKLTLNLGVRVDMFDGWSPDQTTPAGAFVPAFSTQRVDAHEWRDISPRLGVSYDLFGSGKTAIKGSFGRYVAAAGAGNVQPTNPVLAIVTQANRLWTDANNDNFPQGDPRNPDANGELGPISDRQFGFPRITTFFDPDMLTSNRGYTWQGSVGVEHELIPNVGMNVSYFRTSHGNQTVVDNTLVTPSDFDPFCVTTPSDARLPGGGGQRICDQFNVNPSKFGQVRTLVRNESTFGDRKETFDGVDFALNARFKRGATLGGGLSLGRSVDDRCFDVDSPQGVQNGLGTPAPGRYQCRVVEGLQRLSQIKLNGLLPIKYGIELSAVYQNLPGAVILANGIFTNAQVAGSLGRNLSGCPAVGACNLTVAVAMIEPNTESESRVNQLDIRIAKQVRSPMGRFRLSMDLFNAFNNAAILARNNQFGAAWGTPQRILGGRLAKFNAQFNF